MGQSSGHKHPSGIREGPADSRYSMLSPHFNSVHFTLIPYISCSGFHRLISLKDNLLDGVNHTCDDLHAWLTPFTSGQEHLIWVLPSPSSKLYLTIFECHSLRLTWTSRIRLLAWFEYGIITKAESTAFGVPDIWKLVLTACQYSKEVIFGLQMTIYFSHAPTIPCRNPKSNRNSFDIGVWSLQWMHFVHY